MLFALALLAGQAVSHVVTEASNPQANYALKTSLFCELFFKISFNPDEVICIATTHKHLIQRSNDLSQLSESVHI